MRAIVRYERYFLRSNKSNSFRPAIFFNQQLFGLNFATFGSILDFQLNFLGLEGLDLTVTFVHAIFVTFLKSIITVATLGSILDFQLD